MDRTSIKFLLVLDIARHNNSGPNSILDSISWLHRPQSSGDRCRTGGHCRLALCTTVLCTAPASHVKVLDLGKERYPCRCRNREILDSSDNGDRSSNCGEDSQFFLQLAKLEKIRLELWPQSDDVYGNVEFDQVLNGDLDTAFLKSATTQLWKRRLNGDGVIRPQASGREVIIEMTLSVRIQEVLKGWLDKTFWYSDLVSIPIFFIDSGLTHNQVHTFHARNSRDVSVVSREISTRPLISRLPESEDPK